MCGRQGSVFGDNTEGKGGYGASDMFALKLDGEDGSHIWSTQLGSDQDDAAYAVAVRRSLVLFFTPLAQCQHAPTQWAAGVKNV